MPYPLDDPSDWLRLFNLLLFVACFYKLIYFRRTQLKEWRKSTREEWWVWIAWCTAGMSFSLDGALKDMPMNSRPVFLLVLVLFTARSVFWKGKWASNAHH